MKWARVELFKQEWDIMLRPTVMEVIDTDPHGRYIPEIVWHECPDEVQQYWIRDEATDTYGPNYPPPYVPEDDPSFILDALLGVDA